MLFTQSATTCIEFNGTCASLHFNIIILTFWQCGHLAPSTCGRRQSRHVVLALLCRSRTELVWMPTDWNCTEPSSVSVSIRALARPALLLYCCLCWLRGADNIPRPSLQPASPLHSQYCNYVVSRKLLHTRRNINGQTVIRSILSSGLARLAVLCFSLRRRCFSFGLTESFSSSTRMLSFSPSKARSPRSGRWIRKESSQRSRCCTKIINKVKLTDG